MDLIELQARTTKKIVWEIKELYTQKPKPKPIFGINANFKRMELIGLIGWNVLGGIFESLECTSYSGKDQFTWQINQTFKFPRDKKN